MRNSIEMEADDTAGRILQWPKQYAVFLAGTVILLGCLVITGWHARLPLLVQVLPSLVPMQYNTALGFMLSGLGIVFFIFNRSSLSIVCIGSVAVISLVTLTQYMTGFDLGLDQLFIKHYILVKTSNPGRMAPNTALAFLLTSAALALMATYARAKWCRPVAGVIAASVLLLGAVAFVGYAVGTETGYGWGQFTRMAVHTAFGFVLLGTAILMMTWVPVTGYMDVDAQTNQGGVDTSSSTIVERRRIIAVSILIMCIVSMTVGISIVRELYYTTLEEERIGLEQTLDSWVKLIEMQAQHNQIMHPGAGEALTLSEIRDTYEEFGGFRETGEIILARQGAERINILLWLRHEQLRPRPNYAEMVADWGEPMHKALTGQSGTLVGKDYRGEMVLAAYHHIESLDMGLVAKVNLDEIKRPFIHTALLAGGITLVVIMLGSMAFMLKVNPMLRRLAVTHDLERSVQSLERILDHSWDEIYTYDSSTLKFLEVSHGARQNLGYSMNELRQLTPIELMPEFTHDQFEALINPLRQDDESQIFFETNQQRKDGTQYPVGVRLHLSSIETPPLFVAITQDITERKHYIDKLKHKALYDQLTDLPNRSLLEERLKQALKLARREASQLAVLSIDIVRLGEINDLMGHDNGDIVLREVSSRLQNALRESDTVARIGGDEFFIVLPTVNLAHTHVAVKKINTIFEQPIVIDDTPLEIEAAIGIALYPDHGDNSAILMQHADIAMRIAKYETNAYSVYNPENDPSSLLRLRLHGELRQAINEEKLMLHYQPKIDIRTGKIESVEALSRWPHPIDGMIPPIEFIPIIEQSGMIRPFTYWVLKQAIKQSKRWTESGIDITIAVNLSARNLLDPGLPGNIKELLESYKVSPACLSLEITESAVMSRPKNALKGLTALHEMGINISIDDFGTGYSSLVYLKEMPIDELKIDQSFVFGLPESSKDSVIVSSTITLAHNLGLRVVAEGVENQDTLEYLASLNCDIAQGYHISRPLPEHELEHWLLTSAWCPPNLTQYGAAHKSCSMGSPSAPPDCG